MKKTIATLAPIGPFREDYSEDDFKRVISMMRVVSHPDFSNLNSERVPDMRSACVASVILGVEAHLVADYGHPVRGWPASLRWEVPGVGTAFVSREVNKIIDNARTALDEEKAHG